MRSRLWPVLLAVLVTVLGCSNESGSGSAERKAAAPPSPGAGTPTVLVAYHSLTGYTESLAAAVVEGVERVAGVRVAVKKVAEVTKEDLGAAEGLVLGCPTHFANVPGEMLATIGDWSWKMKVDFTGKVGGAFATAGHPTGGKEHVLQSLILFMLNNRMVVVGPLDGPRAARTGKIGAAAVTGSRDKGLDDAELGDARRLGERVATYTKRLHGRTETE